MCKVQLIPFGSIPNGCFWFGKDASKEWSGFLLSHVPLFPLIEMPVLRHVIVGNYDTELADFHQMRNEELDSAML